MRVLVAGKTKTALLGTKRRCTALRFVPGSIIYAEETASRVCDERHKTAPLTPFLPPMGNSVLDTADVVRDVKTPKSSKSLQLPHSIPEINFANVSSRCH